MANLRQSTTPVGIARCDLVDGSLPLRRIRSGAFREDDPHGLCIHVGRQLLECPKFRTRIGRVSIEKMVRESLADDVQTGIHEQLPLQHVPRLHPRKVGYDVSGHQ